MAKWYNTTVDEFLAQFETPESKYFMDLYEIYYDISTAIFNYRNQNKLTKKQIAKKLDITVSMLTKYENGDYDFRIEQIYDVCKKLGWELEVKINKK